MADVPQSSLGLLVTVLYLLSGVSGETLSMFSRVGDDVSLPCNNVIYPNCSSTVWIYNRDGSTGTIEVVTLGKIKVDQTERLSLGSNCSLHVSDVRAEDAGLYICQQYLTKTGPQHGGDAPVDLSVLTISSTTPVTDLKPNDTQDSSCDITLTVTLQKKDNNRKWTCTLTEKGNMKISIDFTSMFSGSQNLFLTVTVGLAVAAAVCVTAVVIIVRRRRDKNQVPTDNSIGLNAVNHSTPPTNEDQVEDQSQPADRITYASIDHFNQNPPHRVNANSKDAVMYASVMPSSGRGRETENPADPSSLYSTVK
ncbi:uncharacterized protein LOC112217852 isoform X1 [Oncorhynchus tshawytscha]|uniref:uncharacterized protein LOC112217852 isoform X1 n=1 Tax=Oncorhynchus tshawytscha TaxID=74940 RepID=UPI001C3E5912|nr:uncharacterized protein LOC112217852 isoform X1 [Oncorhynchus tshawytscha]